MNHFILGILKIVILEAAAAMVVLDRVIDRFPTPPGRGPKHEQARRLGFGTIALLAALAFLRFGELRGEGSIVHTWEQFHFYIGAKYQKEVGWFDLYKAVFLADRESTRVLGGLTETRDLHTFDVIPVAVALQDGPRVRAKFTDARWEEFKADWAVLAQQPADWRNVLRDHGNSNSPAWSIFAHPIASVLPLTHASQVAIAWLDLLLMAGLWAAIYWAFGVRVASVTLVVAACAPNVFDYLAGSFLRWDWLFAVAMALCFLQRKRYATAGAFFGYAVATKLFPLFFGVTFLVRAGVEVARTRAVPARYWRFGGGAMAALLASVVISSAMFGTPRVWLEYKDRIEVAQHEKFYGIQYSLKTVFLQFVSSSPAEQWSHWAAPLEIKQARGDVDIADHAFAFFVVQLLFTLLVMAIAARSDEVSAFALGPLLVFTWLTVNMYYWNMLGFVALGLALRKDRPAFLGVLGLLAIWASFYFYQHTNHGHAEGYFVALLMASGIIALGATQVRLLFSPAPAAAPSVPLKG